jgi:hypothetical protein
MVETAPHTEYCAECNGANNNGYKNFSVPCIGALRVLT